MPNGMFTSPKTDKWNELKYDGRFANIQINKPLVRKPDIQFQQTIVVISLLHNITKAK